MANRPNYYQMISFDEKNKLYEMLQVDVLTKPDDYFDIDRGGRVRFHAKSMDYEEMYKRCIEVGCLDKLPSVKKQKPTQSYWGNQEPDFSWDFKCALRDIANGVDERLERDKDFVNARKKEIQQKKAADIAQKKAESKQRCVEQRKAQAKHEQQKEANEKRLNKQDHVPMSMPLEKFLDFITMKNYLREYIKYVDISQVSDDTLEKILQEDYLLAKHIENPDERVMLATVKASKTGIRQFKNPPACVKKLHKLLWNL